MKTSQNLIKYLPIKRFKLDEIKNVTSSRIYNVNLAFISERL
ncbi:hypothetical protein THF1C08_90191 [Vibrio jasicida]|nr:hypothetical protein THF1C08_90191 [Vibrio jasicida]